MKNGFTVLEFIFVIVVAAILAAAAIPNLVKEKSSGTELEKPMNELVKSMDKAKKEFFKKDIPDIPSMSDKKIKVLLDKIENDSEDNKKLYNEIMELKEELLEVNTELQEYKSRKCIQNTTIDSYLETNIGTGY